MKTEYRELLLKDLCARLPHNPYIFIKEDHIKTLLTSIEVDKDGIAEIWYSGTPYSIEDVKPYLRPMSSMTEEEMNEFDKVLKSCNNKVFACSDNKRRYNFFDAEQEDFMNAHHFDYRGLIPMGLALEAPEGMYRYFN